MLKLPNVTLISFDGKSNEESGLQPTIQALIHSCKEIEFGSVKLVSHIEPKNLPSPIKHEYIDKIKDIDQWSHDIIYKFGQYVDTDFAILVHADGFIVNPDSWRDEFLEYDYIGAPWPLPNDNFSYRDINGEVIRVGNSVSLRSKRLIDLPVKLNMEWKPFHGFYNEDGFICVNNRHIYIENGMKFADIEVAKYFSHETMIPEIEGIKPFAFHRYFGTNSKYPKF